MNPNLTKNFNLLQKVSFKVIFDSVSTPNVEYFVVTATVPNVTINAAPSNFKNQKGFFPGETLEFETLQLRIAVDEDFHVYAELFEWVKSHTTQTDLRKTDLVLIIMTSHNNPKTRVKFKNAFPTNLGSIEFNAQETDIEYAYLDVTFQYDYFEIETAGITIC